jgi:hypothetical protein
MDPFLSENINENCSKNLYATAINWTGKILGDFSLKLSMLSYDQPYYCGG